MNADRPPRTADVVVVGAGVVGAACAALLAAAGLSVCVIDRAGPAAGSSSSGEGNLLVSDKLPGPELDLALHSLALWRDFAARAVTPFEFDAKGGLVVAGSAHSWDALHATAEGQLFPFLRDVRTIRGYLGFRPSSPDHLPIIGAGAPGVWLATGHEGAGVGLAMGTADLLRSLIVGERPAVDPSPFEPSRLVSANG